MPQRTKRNYPLIIRPALAVILLDRISKLVLIHYLRIHESVPVLKGFFNLVHVRNRGMAFGLMNRPDFNFSSYFLIAAGIGAIILLIFWFIKLKEDDRRMIFGFSLILGGAVGNLIDRIRYGEVVDFLDFHVGTYHWPAFNVADSSITVGAFLVAISLVFSGKKADQR
ncbi:MAG: signal peptidase II [Desulfobacterales bacterium]|nr:signal peptidase II [Desulfobacterales bacterium]